MEDIAVLRMIRRALILEYLTLVWNGIGTAILAFASWEAGSIALAGFGLDSLVEILASVVVVWELKGTGLGREKKALRIICVAFFSLAAYVLAQSMRSFLAASRPETSPLGIVWLALTVVTMLLLALGKARTGAVLGNDVLKTEARVTLVDAFLAASVLLGLVLNALLGWWWADPLAGLVLVVYGLIEGRHAWNAGS